MNSQSRFPLLCKFCFLLVPFVYFGLGAQSPAEEVPRAWTAQWVAIANAPSRDFSVGYFRRELTMSSVPSSYLVDVSGDTRFELHVNGRRVGAGPALADVHHWRYERFDLAPYLRAGQNIIAAEVWNYGEDAAVAQMSARTAFLLRAEDPANATIDTGQEGWSATQEMGRSVFRTATNDYYAAGPPEKVDGRILDWDWDGAQPEAERWRPVVKLGRACVRGVQDSPTPWMLVEDPLPPMKYDPTVSGKIVRSSGIPGDVTGSDAHALEIPAHSDIVLLLDRRSLTTAFPSLSVSGVRDAEISLTYAEALYNKEGHKGDRNVIEGRHIQGLKDEFIADGQNRTFRTLWWRTWRYLQVEVKTGSDPLHLEKLEAFYTAYPFKAEGSFASDDPELKRIWETGWLTAQLCSHETYMDTPYWEQLQYIGDTRIQSLISYGVTGDDRLARQAMQAFFDSLMPEGLTQSRYPSNLTQMIPPFSLMWVGMLHDFWLYRDDPAFLRTLLPGTRGVLDWFEQRQRKDGLLGRIEWWPFVDWSPPGYPGGAPPQQTDGGSSALTLQYIEALRDAADLEDALGEKFLAVAYRDRAQRSAAALLRLSWNESEGLLADTPARDHFSEQANALAVWLDVIPKARQRAVMEKLIAMRGEKAEVMSEGSKTAFSPASYYFRFYVARALVHAGLGDLYVGELAPWRGMLKLGLSTWAEQPEPTRSDSHAWSAHPTLDLTGIVAGITPGGPGFKKIRVEPHLAKLSQVEGSMATPRGLVRASYEKRGDAWLGKFDLPAGTEGTLHWHGRLIPLHAGSQQIGLR